mgnify:CR=1 FL=1
MKRPGPGVVQFTSEELEWLYTQILSACQIAERAQLPPGPSLLKVLDKLDRARFVDAIEVPMVSREVLVESLGQLLDLHK